MKKITRRKVFETNSSSAHSLSVRTRADEKVPSSGHFVIEENYFGWTGKTVITFEDKLSYLYALSVEMGMSSEEFLEKMSDILPSEVSLELPVIPKEEIYYRVGIDHQSVDLLEYEGVSWEDFIYNHYMVTIDHDNH